MRSIASLIAMNESGVLFQAIFDSLCLGYAAAGEPLTAFHPFSGKLIPQIHCILFPNNIFTEPGQVVLDPFCGSGTVLLESVLHRRHGVGADSNPLALLISSAKVTTLTPETLRSDLRSILLSAKSIRRPEIPNVPNMRYWFYPHVIEQLSRLVSLGSIVDGQAAENAFRSLFLPAFARG